MSELFEIDGSVLEGGGQILRNSISLSAILGIPVRIKKIRAGRIKQGLAPQHLTGIQLVANMCQAVLKGAKLGSTEIEFTPGKLKSGNYFADPKTAGSISLLLQVALPCALLADGPVLLNLKGGTNVDMAPQVDYMTEVFLPTLNKFGAEFELDILKRGYYPRGLGHVKVNIRPVRQFRPVEITEHGILDRIHGWSYVSGTLPIQITHQTAEGAKEALLVEGDVSIECYREEWDLAPHNCSGIILVAETSTGCVLGSDGIGKRPVDPHVIGGAAGNRLRDDLIIGACLDTKMQDQVIIYMSLASGRSVVRVGEVTLHTKTAIHVAELMAKAKFNIIPDGDTNLIECTGIGFTNESVLP